MQQTKYCTNVIMTTRLRPELRPEGSSGWGLGRGTQPPTHQLEGLGSAVSSPAGSGAEQPPILNLVHINRAYTISGKNLASGDSIL